MKYVEFEGLQCVEIGNGYISLLATVSVGPRILTLKTPMGENIFAVLPEATLDCPGSDPFHFYGGHRLWHAPEEPSITYLPDDSPVEVEALDNGLRLTQTIEPKTSLQKALEIQLSAEHARVTVNHTITNHGEVEVTLAPWAITQLKPGGVAILPQYTGLTNENPTLPNRSFALWPYTDINSDVITWGNEFILVNARMNDGKLKIGFPNPEGWMAYWIDEALFIKRASYDPDAEYFDRGSSSECYCDPSFLELETLAPVTQLKPGERIEHVEIWQVCEDIRFTEDLAEINAVINKG